MSIQVSPGLVNVESVSSESTATSQSYWTELLNQRPKLAETDAELGEIREQAFALASELSLPTRRDEEWRFTDLSALMQVKFSPALPNTNVDVSLFTVPEAASSHLVFVNGFYVPELSDVSQLPEGVKVGNLSQMSFAEIKAYLGKQPGADEVFTALNTASFTDGAVVMIPRNQQIEMPIHLLFVSTGGDRANIAHPRCLIVAQANSQATIVEHYTAVAVANLPSCLDVFTEQPYFTNAVTEIWLENNAQVHHARIQREAGNAFHVGKTAVSQGKDSRYYSTVVTLGAKLSRHNFEVFQRGEGTHATLNGLALISGEQIADTHSAIAYNHPHGSSRQLHKCIVDSKARAVFNGKVFVPKPAQLTDAGQLNRTLLLSPQARVDTKPQLEITADNVKCSHGATVGQLDEEEIFYLQSRGLDLQTSRNLLVDAFAAEIINELPVDSLKNLLKRCVACRTNI